MKVLVTGASGYIGGQLTQALVGAGHQVTVMVRDARRLPPSFPDLRMVEADASRPDTLLPALHAAEVAYYLIHSMSGQVQGFEERDRQAARNFAMAAKCAGVRRVIYLGGLAARNSDLSSHLKSRHETGAVLREFGPPLVELRAGIIVGNGSVSFEIIRSLTERLPVMVCPRWVVTRTQPVAVGDVLAYLEAALHLPSEPEEPVEIGGSTIETYRSMMLGYAKHRGLRRYLIKVPVLTPRLSSYWLDFVTSVSPAVSRPLIEGLRNESVCTSTLATRLFPSISPISYPAAVAKTFERSVPAMPLPRLSGKRQMVRAEGVICDVRFVTIDSPASLVFQVLTNAGGKNGWFFADVLWRLRGWIDQVLGGVGMKPGRPRSAGMEVGDAIDFWRVERVVAPSTLLLRAEMKVPGAAWLQFDLSHLPGGGTCLRCCAWFQPRGLSGEIYWACLYPFHALIFSGMLRAIKREAERFAKAQAG